jgi:NSS family neurotransmitter:Na+ symporter
MIQGSRFGSRLGTLLAMAGVAIGLGNVWRFPYMMGQNGGSAFLLLYLGLMICFAIPALAAEWALGRSTRSGTLGALSAALGSRLGLSLGAVLVIGILIANSYYMVVIGNILFSAGYSIWPGFSADQLDGFSQRLANGDLQYVFALVILMAGLWVIARGVNAGIEAVSRLFVPFFGLVMLYLLVQSLLLEGAIGHLLEFLRPDFSRIGVRELFAALGQACFSLGIGGTFMVIYGSYLKEDSKLASNAIVTGVFDTSAALLAALFIVPAVLAFGLDMTAGPALIFNTLPQLFSVMPGGWLAGSLFLLALTLIAFLSAVAGLEVCVAAAAHFAGDRLKRGHLILALGGVEAVLMWPSAHSNELIGQLDLIFGSGMLVFGAIVAVVALIWGLGKATMSSQILPGQTGWKEQWLTLWLRWVVPLAFGVILLLYIYERI